MAIFVGTPDSDYIEGTEEDDEIYGMGGQDYLNGLGGDDYIESGDGDPDEYNGGGSIDGGTGADTMIGGEGANEYIVDNVNDVVIDTGTQPTALDQGDSILTHVNFALGEGIEDITAYGNQVTSITGNALDNVVYADISDQDMVIRTLDGNDTIYSFNFSDQYEGRAFMEGGKGDDTYFIVPGDVVIELEDEGIDTVQGGGPTYTLPDNVENLQSYGAGPGQHAVITGNNLDNVISFYSSVRSERDEVYGLGGNDRISSDNNSLLADGGDGNDTLLGNANLPDFGNPVPADVLIGGAGDDLLITGGGDDSLTGGEGTDRFEIQVSGGNATISDFNADFDRIGFAESDTVALPHTLDASMVNFGTEATTAAQRFIFDESTGALYFDADGNGGGAQTQIATVNVVSGTFDFNDLYIAPNPNTTVINGTNGADTIHGTDGGDEINAGGGNDLVIAEDGDDQVFGGDGNDELRGSQGADVLFGDAGNDVVNGSDGEDVLYGGSGNDTLLGQGNSDTLDGGAGADRMEGGEFGDLYIVDNAGDVVVEEGTRRAGGDTVQASINYTLTNNVETLELVGGATQGTGNNGFNLLQANALGNLLRGLGGNDVLFGGDGNDTLEGGGGDDSLTGGLGADMLKGGAGNDTLDGARVWYEPDSEDDNTGDALNGGGGDDRLYAGAGDSLAGGAGNDLYFDVSGSNTLRENAGEGIDTVFAANESFTLGANFEILSLAFYNEGPSGVFQGTGNDLANNISISNVRDDVHATAVGLGGDDYLRVSGFNLSAEGGAGNDTLVSDGSQGYGSGNTLIGGDGKDVFEAYGGDNVFTGGTGADTFELSFYAPGVNTITDFNGSQDTLTIQAGALAGLETEGPLSAAAFRAGSAATTADQHLIYDASVGALYYDSDGNGAAAQELILNIHVASGTFNQQDIDIVA